LLGVALEESNRTAEATQQFLQLMSGQEELPKKKQSGPILQIQMLGSYYDFIRQLMPNEAFEWFQLMQYRYSVYSYRQQQGVYTTVAVRGAGSAGPRSNIQLPANVDNLRPMAVAHLLGIANTLEDDKLNDLSKELESRGVKSAKVLAKLDPVRGDVTAVLPELLEKDPKNETALSILLLQGFGRQNDALAPYYEKSLETFRKSRPQLAFMAAVQAGVNEAKNGDAGDEKGSKPNKYLDEALKTASQFDHPNPLLVMSLTAGLGGRNFGGEDIQIGENYRQKFSALLVKWYPEMSKSPQLGSWAYYSASQSLARNSDPTAYVQFLDDEVSRSQAGAKGPNARMQMVQYIGGRQGQLLVPMSFPPKQLSDFPPHVLASFATGPDNFSPFGNQQETINEEAAKKIAPLLDKIKSPILRILFAHKAEQKDRVDAELKKLLSAKTPVLDAYLLAASLAAEKEQWPEAVQLLQKAQYLPMKQDMRRQVDASIVTAVQAAKAKGAGDKSKDMAELLDAGQKAALRLRRAKLGPQERTELVAAMEELGLKKEAEKLDALANAAGSPRATMAAPTAVYSTVGARSNPDQIAKLMEQGKRDAAAKQLAGEVTAQVRQQLSNPNNSSYYRYQARELRRKVDGHGLADDVLKVLEPGDSKNAQKITEYAMACQMFGRTKPAREALEKVLAERPKEDAARMQLIVLLAPDDPQTAAKLIPQLGKQSRSAFGQMISEMVQDYEATFEQRIGVVRLTIDLLKSMEPGDVNQQQTNWVENMMTMFGRTMGGRRGSLPSLYATKKPERSEYPNQEEIMTERRKVHDELCRQMLKMPELARTGFRYLLASTESQGKPVDEFAAEAERIISSEAAAKPNRAMTVTRVYYNSGASEVRFRNPEEFLATRAWKANDWKLIDETLLPKLSGSKNRETRERLTQLATLYRCEESQFVAEAEKIVKLSKPTQPGQTNEGLAIAVDVWADRGLKVDLQPLVVKQLKADASSPYGYVPPDYVMKFVEGMSKTQPRAKQAAFLEEVATIYLGPAEKRNDFIKKNYDRRQIQYGTPNGRIHSFGQFMDQICANPALMFIALEHLEQYDEPRPVQNFQYRVQESIRQLQSKGPEAAMAMLKQSPWLQDLEHFRPLAFVSGREVPPLGALLRVDVKNADYRQKLREQIEAQQKAEGKTFGGEFILATLDQEKTPAALLEYVGGQMDGIKKLPEKRQQDLAALVRGLLPKNANLKNLSDAGQAAQEWIGGSSAGQAQNLLTRLEKAKRLEEVGISDNQVDDFLRQQMGQLIKSDPKTAVKAFLRIGDLCRDAQKRGQWYMYFSDGETTEGWLLNQTSYSMQPWDLPALIFFLDVINNESKRPIEVTYTLSNVAEQVIQNLQSKASKQGGGGVSGDVRIRRVYEELGSALAGRQSSILLGALYNRLQNDLRNKSTNDKVQAWTASEMGGGKYPELAANLNALAGMVAAEPKAGAKAKQNGAARPEMFDFHQQFSAIMHDEKLPLTWRLYVATTLSQRGGNPLPLEVAKDMVTLYTQALEKGVPIINEQNRVLTRQVVSLVNEKDAEAVVKAWRDAWPKRYLGAQARQQGRQNQFERMNKLSDVDALCTALQVYLTGAGSQMPETATRLMSVYGENIGYTPQTVAVLLRAHQPEEAAKTLRRSAQKLDVNWPNNETTRYDDEIAKELPTMLEKLDREDEKYLAKVLFAAMPDGNTPKRGGEDVEPGPTPRDERLGKLAGEFKSVKFDNPALKRLSLVLLSGSEVAGKQIADEVAAAYDPGRVVASITSDNTGTNTQEVRLAQCHFANLLREGKTEAYVELIKKMSASSGDDDYRFGNALNPFIECAYSALRDKKTKPWSPEACAAVCEALAGSLKDKQYVNINNFENFSTLMGALYAQANSTAKSDETLTKVSDYSRSRFENSGARDEIWRIGLRLNGPPSAENLDARVRYLQNVTRFAFERKWLQRTGTPYRMRNQQDRNYLGTVVRLGFLSHAEMKSRGLAALDGIGPKDEPTYAKAVLANWLQSEKDFEEAAQVWRSMIKIAPDAKKVPKNEANYVLGLAVCLKNLQKYDEALAALAMLEGKDFDASLKGSFDQYKREVQAAKAAVKKTDAGKPGVEKSTRNMPVRPRLNWSNLATWQQAVAV
jgi:hypothetical protein